MIKQVFASLFCLLAVISYAQKQTTNLPYVKPFTGTSPSVTKSTLKHAVLTENLANTIPAATLPFAMIQWTPQTRTGEQKCVAPYYYNDPYFSGIRGTHWLSGSCVPDYGSFTIMPLTGRLRTALDAYKVRHQPAAISLTPAHLAVSLPQYNVKAEVAPTLRCSMMQFTASEENDLHLLALPNSDKAAGFIQVDRKNSEIVGYNPVYRIYQGWGQPAGFNGYFVVQFEKGIGNAGTFAGDTILQQDTLGHQKDIGAYVSFRLKKDEVVRMRIGTSFTSLEEARNNLRAEIPHWDFNRVRSEAEAIWNKGLAQVQVATSLEKDKEIFYTALYHAMLHPRLYNDVSGRYPMFDHQYQTAQLQKGAYYDDFPMWDIHRAQLPLWTLLQPSMVADFARSMVLKGQQGGWMPIFPCWNSFTSAMIGDHVAPFLASAYRKGIRDFDVKEAYRLLRQNAFQVPDSADYINGKGRRALPSYLQYGYVPLEDSVWEAFHKREQVSRTLEYSFDDHALSVLAKAVGAEEDYKVLLQRGKNYRNVFDKNVGFMNGRYADGGWYQPFDPDEKHSFITEGTPRHYSFFVPHDVEGLIELMGGKKALEAALDSLFIEEQYWHGNEPCHAIPFLYNYTDSPWKTQKVVHDIMREEYDNGTGGLSGNDDAGQMSAWYVFAAIGLYPADPVSDWYQLTAPHFDEVVLQLPNSKQFRLKVKRKTPGAIFIESMKLNGVPYNKRYLLHRDLVKGGTMEFQLSATPGPTQKKR